MSERGHDDAVREWWSLEGTIPLGGVAEGSSWHRARSADTGDLAALLLVEGPAAQEVADAARRAYLVQNPGLLEILDIQSFEVEDGSGPLTAISYAFPPAPPLAAMLAGGELRAETARTVIGEAARALEVARRRGLRHEHLDSNRIFVDVDKDRVWVLGVGVEAASHRLDHEAPTDGAEAAFADVAALGRLLYRSMTGVAPHADDQGRLIPPSAATARRVPADLDELCVLILTGAPQAPGTVRDLISELGAWQSLPVTLEAYDPHDAGRGDTRGDGDVPADDDAADTVQNDTDGGAVDAAAPDEERPDQPDQPEETRVHDVAPGVGGAIVGGGAVAGAAAAVTARHDERDNDEHRYNEHREERQDKHRTTLTDDAAVGEPTTDETGPTSDADAADDPDPATSADAAAGTGSADDETDAFAEAPTEGAAEDAVVPARGHRTERGPSSPMAFLRRLVGGRRGGAATAGPVADAADPTTTGEARADETAARTDLATDSDSDADLEPVHDPVPEGDTVTAETPTDPEIFDLPGGRSGSTAAPSLVANAPEATDDTATQDTPAHDAAEHDAAEHDAAHLDTAEHDTGETAPGVTRPADSTEPDAARGPEDDPGDVEAVPVEDALSAQARGFVRELHLTTPRDQATFPAHLAIEQREPLVMDEAEEADAEPAEADAEAADTQVAEADAEAGDDTEDHERAPSVAGAAAGSAAAGSAAAGSAVAGSAVAGPVDNDDANDEVDHAPSDDTHLPSDRGHDPSDPEHSPSDSDDRAGTVEQTDTDTNAPADVRQQDRTDDTEEDASDVSGPMIVPGRRDASPDAEPFEHPSTPLSGSSLWRDVVGIALDSDTKKSGYEVAPRHSQQQSRQAPWILIGALLVVILAAVLAITTITSALRGDRGTAPTGSAAESTAVVTHPEVPGDDVTVAVPSESMPSPTDLPVL